MTPVVSDGEIMLVGLQPHSEVDGKDLRTLATGPSGGAFRAFPASQRSFRWGGVRQIHIQPDPDRIEPWESISTLYFMPLAKQQETPPEAF